MATTVEDILQAKADELRDLGLGGPIIVSASLAWYHEQGAGWTVHGTIRDVEACWAGLQWDDLVRRVTLAIGPRALSAEEIECVLAL